MKRVTIYTTSYCAWSARAKDLLRSKRVYFDEIDVTGDFDAREKLMAMTGGARTVPQVFVGDHHLGGYRDLIRLEEDGRLDALLGIGVAESTEAVIQMS
ncbi:MAG: glutaredoxin 3 [Myxococcaceae bacterium]